MSTYSNSAREVEMPDGNVVVLHKAPTGGANTTSNIKKFKYDDNGHVTESTAADAEDLNLSGYSTPTTGTTAIGTSDDVQTAIGKLDHQSQIDQTNILYAINTGVKNWLVVDDVKTDIFTLTAGELTVNGSASGSDKTFRFFGDGFVKNEFGGKYLCSLFDYTDNRFLVRIQYSDNGTSQSTIVTVNSAKTVIANAAYFNILFTLLDGKSASNVKFSPMICDGEIWDTTNHDFKVGARPNSDLTQLEAEDRAALAELVDSGSKNEFSCFYINAPNARGLTFTNNHDGSITITGNNNGAGDSIAAIRQFTSSEMAAMAGYILSGIPTNSANASLFIQKDGSPYNNVAQVEANEEDVIESVNYSCTAFLMIPKDTQNVNVTVRPIICSKPKYSISPKYIFNGYKLPVKHANITTIEAGGYVKLGKLVNVVIRCVVGSDCSAYTSLFTGLPFPASGLSAGANFVACASNQSVPIIICANGTIQNGETLPAMTQLLISATYICL